ncbi:hypothetical protein [Sinomicrobium pectinilyticum]|uniref:Uncharacterized protein n=1 Tax=Sinomicrobium pectinilyticum TaxID=1084421 RepID=A0A3N0DQT0_SINP1|nr:hypothetical protein [Sinomicrobium pectinilyticum]RNL77998.1 hypothetical protein ED312_20065 [Sinomicrobium pectinilyticum]
MKNKDELTPYFYTVIAVSALTIILMVATNAADRSLAWIFFGFLLYIPLLFVKNRVLIGIVIAAEYLFLLSVFWLFMMLLKYEPGGELVPLALFIVHSLIRLFIFLKVAGSRYALLLAIAIALLISIPVYWYGTTDYLKLM